MSPDVLLQRDGEIATLTLSNPERFNEPLRCIVKDANVKAE